MNVLDNHSLNRCKHCVLLMHFLICVCFDYAREPIHLFSHDNYIHSSISCPVQMSINVQQFMMLHYCVGKPYAIVVDTSEKSQSRKKLLLYDVRELKSFDVINQSQYIIGNDRPEDFFVKSDSLFLLSGNAINVYRIHNGTYFDCDSFRVEGYYNRIEVEDDKIILLNDVPQSGMKQSEILKVSVYDKRSRIKTDSLAIPTVNGITYSLQRPRTIISYLAGKVCVADIARGYVAIYDLKTKAVVDSIVAKTEFDWPEESAKIDARTLLNRRAPQRYFSILEDSANGKRLTDAVGWLGSRSIFLMWSVESNLYMPETFIEVWDKDSIGEWSQRMRNLVMTHEKEDSLSARTVYYDKFITCGNGSVLRLDARCANAVDVNQLTCKQYVTCIGTSLANKTILYSLTEETFKRR